MVEATEREVHVYVTTGGKSPFEDWLTSLRDKRAKAKILSRLDRVRLGNLGDCRSLQEGLVSFALPRDLATECTLANTVRLS